MELNFVVSGEESGAKLGIFLRRQGVSLAVIRSLKFTSMGICVNKAKERTSYVVKENDIVTLNMPQETEFSAFPQDLPIDVVYEDLHTMVLEKQAGQVVHPDLSHREDTLANAFCGMMQKRGDGGIFRPIGRLDCDTSGLVPCAMNAAVAQMMSETMHKEYVAVVEGAMPLGFGVVDAPLGAVPGSAIKQQVCSGAKKSRTEYEVLAAGNNTSIVIVRPKTGRTHQIRVHFSYIGHPLLGDSLYGGNLDRIERHALHCRKLKYFTFDGEISIKSDIPPDMAMAAGEHLVRVYKEYANFN